MLTDLRLVLYAIPWTRKGVELYIRTWVLALCLGWDTGSTPITCRSVCGRLRDGISGFSFTLVMQK